uniref:3-hydroxy-3-methylglutaryl coenzyme A reductase n=1 Tax=Rhabditophanes sp. KR3021 TaxID=114890 RepID=A0AC35UAS9_9BILA
MTACVQPIWQDLLREKVGSYVDTMVIDEEGKWKFGLTDQVVLAVESIFKSRAHFDIFDDGSSSDEDVSQLVKQPNEVVLPAAMNESGKGEQSESVNEIVQALIKGTLKPRELEAKCGATSAVANRRSYMEHKTGKSLSNLPSSDYDYEIVKGACCENVIGYVPVPVGVAGPLKINNESIYVPLATTEGALVASTNRGCKAITDSGGVSVFVNEDGMTRAPVVEFKNVRNAVEFERWVKIAENYREVKKIFDETSRYARLSKMDCDVLGRYVHIRFKASTGDAMGMNMISKAVEAAMTFLKCIFQDLNMLSLSGNQCVDKKSSALNWIDGRGKSVIAEATIPASIIQSVLKTNVDSMVKLTNAKLHIGTSATITIGGWNAHAANIVTAIFLATGQDAAQIVSSSMCLTQMEKINNGDLYITCTMKCLEVGTVGGGTILAPQKNMLDFLACAGSNIQNPGENSRRLAQIICGTVLAGELSLMAAQCTGDLVKSHLIHNRSNINLLAPADNSARVESNTNNHYLDSTLDQVGSERNRERVNRSFMLQKKGTRGTLNSCHNLL